MSRLLRSAAGCCGEIGPPHRQGSLSSVGLKSGVPVSVAVGADDVARCVIYQRRVCGYRRLVVAAQLFVVKFTYSRYGCGIRESRGFLLEQRRVLAALFP